MKKAILTGIFVFSLALNAAVAATVGWYYWKQSRWESEAGKAFAQATALTGEDLRAIRQMWPPEARMKMMETRKKILDKNVEVLDTISRHPGDMAAAEKNINELLALRANMEREALGRMSTILANLPVEKREAFAQFVRTRCCMGRSMGMGRGMGMEMGPGFCPAAMPPGSATPP
jgi:hypothetical protein